MTKKPPRLPVSTEDVKETLRLGYEEVVIYPEYCVREKQNCAQCVAEGKIKCTYASEKRHKIMRKKGEVNGKGQSKVAVGAGRRNN